MNCKPNDLAMVVVANDYPNLLGKIVQLTDTCETIDDMPCWILEEEVLAICSNGCCEEHIIGIPDEDLAPIPKSTMTERSNSLIN